jgi:hypothetical protein
VIEKRIDREGQEKVVDQRTRKRAKIKIDRG